MSGSLRVATPCPACGAAVDFEEGSQLFRCGYCGSNLWITGYHRTLTYSIPAKIISQAATIVALREIPARLPQYHLKEVTLAFVPYYRYVGAACWLEEEEIEKRSDQEGGWGDGAEGSSDRLLSLDPAEKRWVFKSRRVERTFMAATLPIPELYSLGMRAGVLPLFLFKPESLVQSAVLFPIEKSEGEAIEIGAKEDASERGYQPVAGRLSVIYFPYYLARCERGEEEAALVIDGVTGDVAAVSRKRLALPPSKPPESFATIHFRSLKCPNCGWGFPPRAQDIILACSTCGRAWQAQGENLVEIPSEYGAPPKGVSHTAFRYLPFWSMTIQAQEILPGLLPGARLRIPAFGVRNMKVVHPVTLALLAKQLQLSSVSFERGPILIGCFYDGDEARRLGKNILILFLLQQACSIDRAEKIQFELGEPRLTWIPFLIRGIEYIEPATKLGFLSNLIL